MSSTVEKLGPSRVKLTVEIPFADLKPHLDKAYVDIASSVTIPGFRKGKVPPLVIDQRFGRGAVLQEAINSILPSAYEGAVVEAKVSPLGEPEIEITKLEDGEVIEFSAEVDIRPEFEVPDFAELSAVVDAKKPVEDEVTERIDLLRSRFATTAEVDRPAADGDRVTLDLVASRDGEPLPDGTAVDIAYIVGSGGMIDGLDVAVVGLSVGEEAEFASTLVGGALEGEPADIKVTVKKVAEQTLPEVDDEFASMISEFDTVEEMKADLAKGVEANLEAEQVAAGRDKIIEAMVAATDFEVPAGVVASEVDARKEQINGQLAQAGLTLERYLEQTPEETSRTVEDFWAELEANTVKGLKAQLILDKIADDAEFNVEQEDLSKMIVQKAMRNGTTPEAEAQHMMEHNHLGAWMAEIRRNKAMGEVVAKAKVTDTDGAVVDITMRTGEAMAESDH
ncbi:trigger factor [Propionicimonas sp.]|uniref:trigger factor n=1 Tax=Propionicimonas sp. TaxID=1955623 RepID=UPI0017F73A1B|nr:trigger factor [Propionicimonas sp.]MBU3975951.1 trigger factor [Actinomycetota bacterium]MBA3020766.1 trigger factor [Propionicimonas sp.]MBU3985141.1 trigger factor [Actinomycetota bacterium]MBU4008131.1 trigger factor [Actinomycetota bacterium]MBU4064655.1 trigger factor [Actinomycetota bacterium]